MAERSVFPFTAIVGQDAMKLALVLNAVNPAVGGVLIRGEKGTGKTTAVRALARLLPEHEVVQGCHFGCDPAAATDSPGLLCSDCRARLAAGQRLETSRRRMRVIELPINASEDRVVGAIDLEAALREGARRFEPGVLAEANRNILYVDEVNLLDDHIVDILLDAAAAGVNVVEREGISVQHPARFILVGTMNPEEGDLRPQLLDRFGLCVDVEGIRDVPQRVRIVQEREAWEHDPVAYESQHQAAEDELAQEIARGIAAYPAVRTPAPVLAAIAGLSVALEVDGHRSDLVAVRAAQALAALEGRREVTRADVSRVAEMVLAHRVPSAPFGRPGVTVQEVVAQLAM
ncbi:MAG: ATP-binding protein [Candidatus Dormibacteria bacterium]